jgi:catechol 2,3-dioxygenase-like lactoylglutathione lyase family enzyme
VVADRAELSAQERGDRATRRCNGYYLLAMPAAPTIDELLVGDDAGRWADLGFTVSEECRCEIGGVRLRFLSNDVNDSSGRGILGWTLREIATIDLDGLPTTVSEHPPRALAPAHPNGVVAIDHIVAASPSLDRSVDVLQRAGLDLRRVRDQPTPAGAPRQAFFRLGAEILELIQEPEHSIQRAGGGRDRPARFWGLAVRVVDLDRTVELLGSHVSEIRPAVQAGRRIATLRRSAGLTVPLALMSAPAKG